jgi:phage shock protein PspC (stress-responsive transcriptional regulator)
MLGGVCAGVGEYLAVDATFVRLFFALLAFAEGVGVLVYLVMWLLIPADDQETSSLDATLREGAQEIAGSARSLGSEIRGGLEPGSRASILIGGGLILAGGLFLLDQLYIPWLAWLKFNVIWPVAVIFVGVVFLLRYFRESRDG